MPEYAMYILLVPFVLFAIYRRFRTLKKTQRWKKVVAIVDSSYTRGAGEGSQDYVDVHYELGGQKFRVTRVRHEQTFNIGDSINLLVDPENPANCMTDTTALIDRFLKPHLASNL
ncbi:DUF3592 domain-containing protein [Rhizobium sp. BK376]|uniref:DUF3592 domain-containing protein n=1 Tax=Rhizobium sp. BK376 TaxID=2512149 RepID=UPI00104FE430|nr:DUF3592 domain-containing protein [Rhizobium sp. BK376]TCR93190.1 hypothetical protein EV561_101636 [Rhizobium sp. BK376]